MTTTTNNPSLWESVKLAFHWVKVYLWNWLEVPAIVFAPAEWAFLQGPLLYNAVRRAVIYGAGGEPDPSFVYYLLEIEHFPYIAWGTWPVEALIMFLLLAVGFWFGFWIALYRHPYDLRWKVGWYAAFFAIVLMLYCQW